MLAIIRYLNYKVSNFFFRYYKILFIKSEIKKINNIENIDRDVYLFYDNYSSPHSYGDFFNMLMLSRVLASQFKKVNFFVIDGDYRLDWILNDNDKINYLNDQKIIANTFTKKKNIKYKTLLWNDFLKFSENSNFNSKILFKNRIQNRKSIYNFAIDFINNFINSRSKSYNYSFLLNKNNFKLANNFFLNQKYITVNVRRSNWSKYRDTKDFEFKTIIESLINKFKKYKILIISDDLGCKYFKRISNKYNFNCYFSKDYGKSFIDDVSLILNSDFYFQYKGGGMAVIPIFSKISYLIIQKLDNDKMIDEKKFVYWQKKNQKFINESLDLKYLNSYLN